MKQKAPEQIHQQLKKKDTQTEKTQIPEESPLKKKKKEKANK